jgi:microcystin-dependent protein
MSIANLNQLNIDSPSLNAGVGMGCPAGMISAFAGQFFPAGWLDCDGASYNIYNPDGTESALYRAIGTTYGGSWLFVGEATQAGNLLTITTATSGDLVVGEYLTFQAPDTLRVKIVSFGTGTGGVGTYIVDAVNTIAVATAIKGATTAFNVPNLNESAYPFIRGSTTSVGAVIDETTAPATFTLTQNNIPQCPITFTTGINAQFSDYTFYNCPANSKEDLNNWVLTPEGNQGYFLKADTSQRNGIENINCDLTAGAYTAPAPPTAVAVAGLGAKALLMRYLIKL